MKRLWDVLGPRKEEWKPKVLPMRCGIPGK